MGMGMGMGITWTRPVQWQPPCSNVVGLRPSSMVVSRVYRTRPHTIGLKDPKRQPGSSKHVWLHGQYPYPSTNLPPSLGPFTRMEL